VKRDPVVLIVIALVVTVMLAFGIRMARKSSAAEPASTATGQVAPDFTLTSLDGKTVHLSDFRGKAVMLNFWATWCEPCKIEMPWFVELQKQYASQGLQVLGVAMDDASEQDISKFAQSMKVDYPILIGKDEQRDNVAGQYGGVQFLPETFFIDRDGKIVDKIFGLKGRADIEANIKKSLAAEGNLAQK
jgi:peroxiredoxin